MTAENAVALKSELAHTFREFLSGKEKAYVDIMAPFLLKGCYKQSAQPLEIQEWFAVHDDRIVINPLDLPEEVLTKLFCALSALGKRHDEIIELCHQNLNASMNYCCRECLNLLSAFSGCIYKTGKRPKGGRWSCTICSA